MNIMKHLMVLCTTISFAVLLHVLFASAYPTNRGVGLAGFDQDWIDERNRMWNGLNWTLLNEQCTREQFQIIYEANRVAYKHVLRDGWKQATLASRQERATSSPWNRFFMSPFEPEVTIRWDNDKRAIKAFQQINDIMEKLAWFPKYGKFPHGPKQRVKLLCKSPSAKKCRPGLGAFVQTPTADDDEHNTAWTIVFCPYYFSSIHHAYIQRKADKKDPGYDGLPGLQSFESSLIHEFVHARVMHGGPQILDIKDNLPWYGDEPPPNDGDAVHIYGAQYTHRFAWKWYDIPLKSGFHSVNYNTSLNADNYAWYYTNRYFQKRWNWDDTGRYLDVSTHKSLTDAVVLEAEETLNDTGAFTGQLPAEAFGWDDYVTGLQPFNISELEIPANCRVLDSENPAIAWQCDYPYDYDEPLELDD